MVKYTDNGAMVKALRGAVQVGKDTTGEIQKSVAWLLSELVRENYLNEDTLISVQFTVTKDLVSINPATALRKSGFADTPLFCAQEPDYAGSAPRIIRVLILCETNSGEPLKPVYLGGAEKLRPDISGKG